MQILSLNGTWQLTYSAIQPPHEQWGRSIAARVPGDVHLDLMRAGLICDPLVGDNSTKNRWIEEKFWWYRRTFILPEEFAGQRVELVCEGLDLTAEIWLNGKLVGTANNMFIAHRFDITQTLKTGENEICIRLDVGLEAARSAPTEKFAKSWGREEPLRPWIRKAQQSFYWDVAPRLLTCGIWREISIQSFVEAAIRDVYLTSIVDGKFARVQIDTEIEGFGFLSGEYLLSIEFTDEKTMVRQCVPVQLHRGINIIATHLDIIEPHLWWPNGMGEPHLYRVEIQLTNALNGCSLDQKILRHGIRTFRLVEEPLNVAESTFTLEVNGCKVFCKGGNWVPPDSIYARIDRAKQSYLLEHAREANFNMIRVWGGGIYPDADFYDLCDELGIMVWQDFMFACAYYPDDEPQFRSMVAQEAEVVVRKFRNHASLAVWCGNNETYMMHARVDPQGVFYGLRLYSEILPQTINRLSPGVVYRPSTPYPGPWPGQEASGTQHVWSYVLGWHDVCVNPNCDFSPEELATVMQVWNIPEKNHKFIAEFGVFCPSNLASIQKFMGEHPVRLDSPVYQHHRNHFETDFILEMLHRYYRHKESYSLAEFILAGQMCQAEALKYIFEEFRSRMFACSGTLFWEFNDTWGHIGYSPVDYYLNLKPLYYYMRRAFQPLHVVFRDWGKKVVILNDTPEQKAVTLEYGLQRFTGEKLSHHMLTKLVDPCCAQSIAELGAEIAALTERRNCFAYARLLDPQEQQIDRNRQFLVPTQELTLPEDTMHTTIHRLDSSHWMVDVAAEHFTWMVKIDADENLRCEDNAFDLWPGESRTINVWTEQVYPDLKLRMENINQYLRA